ncbi:hypothetical protein C8R46DRAFT_822620, partial [Mycena filopes]
MALPRDIPTLRAKGTGNLTRPDNVFCSEDFADHIVSCDAYPARTPGTTDHFPIITEFDIVPPTAVREERTNWRATDWEEVNKALAGELGEDVEGYASVGEIEGALERLDIAIWKAVKVHTPVSKVVPHSKRWWTPELSVFRKARDKLSNLSRRQRDILQSPVHELYRVARNSF